MEQLANLPAGVNETLGLVGRLDECLVHGFARLGDDQRRSLDAIAATFAGSPLGGALAEAVEAVGRSEFVGRAFLVLASARVGLLGAVHDALIAQVHQALGRSAVPWVERASAPTGRSSSAMASVQHWLMELAITGFRQLEETGVAPFSSTLENVQADPELAGLATLLTGFHGELLRSMPAVRLPAIPSFRWGDLWSAAFVRTQQLPAPAGFREAAGTFVPLGLDVQSHENFVCALLYGLFDNGEPRTVRIPFTGYKVGVIAGAEVWDLFGDSAEPVLSALADHRTLRVAGAELQEDGDLVLRSAPEPGEEADPFAMADRLTSMPSPPPIARHPVHIAEPVHLAGGHGLPLALERIPAGSPLDAGAVGAASELFGLVRFDRGQWRVQPLCVRRKKGFVQAGEELAVARIKLKHRSVEVLRERASRLLRHS